MAVAFAALILLAGCRTTPQGSARSDAGPESAAASEGGAEGGVEDEVGSTAGAPGEDAAMSADADLPWVATRDEARAAVGSQVRIRGTVFREKMGDSIQSGGLELLCYDFQLPDELVRQQAVVVGTIDRFSPPVAEVASDGSISQGVTMPSTRLVLRDCRVVADDSESP